MKFIEQDAEQEELALGVSERAANIRNILFMEYEMSDVEITISGSGGEFQHHLIGTATLKKILTASKKLAVDEIVSEFLDGGKLFDEAPEPGVYGCLSDAKVTVDGKKIKVINLTTAKQVNDSKPASNYGNFYYIAHGEVTGRGLIQLNGKFDPKKLNFETVDYKILEGWKCASIISRVLYDGNEIDIEWTDDGLEMRHVLCFYKTDKKGAYRDTDIALMFNDEESEWKFDSDPIKDFLI